ncbi:DoxX family protein [Paractinoplanes brasiliensis]|uniref:Putative membrane protein YphA (DoxX/SURF4 family) n=1 Tax=Paractinoplanes brasiliensis TaxID=52695 RepID=A0A4V3C7Y7_9ACTN|nr:DoxX family protein [Actinoplanes brasiliensis]TDO39558.1 putative membrane protein YphA (DoxX/SURF4 family) [Actinoplanes brasiliensis]GID29103.1 hypothetical protein Abr02nite_40860 [Actinoplanes brasiliensis]
MKPVRTAARAMLASIFVIQGVQSFLKPDAKAETAAGVTDRLKPLLEKADPRIPTDATTLVRLKGASDVIAGLALATGHFTRPAAVVLAAGLVPTTIAGHPVWDRSRPDAKVQQIQFLKNLGLFGGLLLAAVDTEGRPGLGYRTSHAASRSQRSVKRAVRTAKREAKIAAMSAAAARKLPG